MDVTMVWIGLIIFLAALSQSLSGFGVALVSMALLPQIIDIRLATPLVAIVGVVVDMIVLLRYREALDVRAIWRVVLASLVGVPLGVILLSTVDERWSLLVLGIVLTGYAVYALLGLKLPRMKSLFWGYAAGFLGGLLGGAYNTSGPPVIVYADCQSWPRESFKSNLNSFFLLSSLVVLLSHVLNGNMTETVLHSFWWSVPFIGAGLLAGFSLDSLLNPNVFRKLVLVLLGVMGLRLIF